MCNKQNIPEIKYVSHVRRLNTFSFIEWIQWLKWEKCVNNFQSTIRLAFGRESRLKQNLKYPQKINYATACPGLPGKGCFMGLNINDIPCEMCKGRGYEVTNEP